ncbi:NADH-quinone oxidoreductase subunit L [Candidatus Providencia siddallii]|uniref:NADH-quinone oxidoreductase subunit L n=1 Tax=Candidatus Providencia siddallii TaxID=1715285 RepID=A0A0M6W7R8_9GAMM|nr:NADH-quinone oxidoreductase subunit L [Candidatus Providencia siddallii]
MNLLYLTILFPLIGFLFLSFSCGRLSENISAFIGVGSVFLSFITVINAGYEFLLHKSTITGYIYKQTLWTCISINNFKIPFILLLDKLSLIMSCIVTGIGFLIHVYSSWYMRGEEGYSRYFAYTNLFISCMLVLVLCNNMISMYFGWEGVGLCSYLLINFYYRNSDNGKKAIKIFLITRISDLFLLIGMLVLWNEIGTLNFADIATFIDQKNIKDSSIITLGTLMLLFASIGKSAQFPLQTWLTDAMVAPTPVSALIHSATMVTAGVYLISRTHCLFLLNPDILYLIRIIGTITLLIGSFSALLQSNIKRILAYSTMSQIGYMFLAIGVQAWDAAIFHLMVHAFFKTLLFLSAGSLIILCNNEQDIFKIDCLYKQNIFIYIMMLIGGSSLSALPLFTAGFYSKSAILSGIQFNGQNLFLLASMFGVLITTIYIFRMIFVMFHGKEKNKKYSYEIKEITHIGPLIILAIFSTFIGALFYKSLDEIFLIKFLEDKKLFLEIISSSFSIVGLFVTIFLYLYKRPILKIIKKTNFSRFLLNWWCYFWDLNWLYNVVFIKPFKVVAWLLKKDPINSLINLLAYLLYFLNKLFLISENGRIRWYLVSLELTAIIIFILLLLT